MRVRGDGDEPITVYAAAQFKTVSTFINGPNLRNDREPDHSGEGVVLA